MRTPCRRPPGRHLRASNKPGAIQSAFSLAEVSVEDLGVWAASSVFDRFVGAPDGKIDGNGHISVKPAEVWSVSVGSTQYHLVHTRTLPYFDHRKGGTIGRMTDTVSLRVASADRSPCTMRCKRRAWCRTRSPWR